jgi:hypothetical protein
MQELGRPLAAITLAVVGAPFPNVDGSNRRFEIMLCRSGEPVELRLDPMNKRDPRAVAVFSSRGVQIGYLSAERCGRIGAIIRSGRKIQAAFQDESHFGAWIRVAFDGQEPIIPTNRRPLPEEPDSGWFADEIWPDD